MDVKKAVVVLSGGMDSTTLLYRVINEGFEVSVLSFDYGQRHKKELEVAKKTCEKLNVLHKIIDLTSVKQVMKNSALTDDIEVPEGHYADENMKSTVVPNRNMIMASIAIAEAVSIEAEAVYLGVHGGDHDIYPDCRKEFIEKLNDVSKIANYHSVEIRAPYLEMDKGDILIEGKELGVDYSFTRTCYQAGEKSCGRCGSCIERILAFKKAGCIDPIFYEKSWEEVLQHAEKLDK